ncbi:MAG: alpha/beta hydrolase, partial [Pseudomonadota bacterium]
MNKFKTSDDFQIGYETFHSGFDQNLLLIHGNMASSSWWRPSVELMKSASDRPEKIVYADWRGYGQSKGLTDEAQIDFDRFADDYLELMSSLNMKDVNVVGHSTGGLIAMLAILKKPQLFKSLTLLDSVGATGLELQLPKDQVLAHFDKMSQDRDYCRMVLAGTIHEVDATSTTFLELADEAFDADKEVFKGVISELADNINITDKMAQLKLPTLILHGDKDLVLPLEGSELLHKQIEGSIFRVLENHGHSTNMEDAGLFVRAQWWSLH